MLGEQSGLGCRLRASLLLLTLDKCLYSHKLQDVGAARNPGVFLQHWQQLFLGACVLKGTAIFMLKSEFLPHRTCLCREEPMVVPAVWFCGLQSNSSHRGRRDADAAGIRASPDPLPPISSSTTEAPEPASGWDGPVAKGSHCGLGNPGKALVPVSSPQQCHRRTGSPRDAQLGIILEFQSLQMDFFPLNIYPALAALTVLWFRPGTGETHSVSQKEPVGRLAPGPCLCQESFPFL